MNHRRSARPASLFTAILLGAAACNSSAGPTPNPGGRGGTGGQLGNAGNAGSGGSVGSAGSGGSGGSTPVDAAGSPGGSGGTRPDATGGAGGGSPVTRMDASSGPAFVCRTGAGASRCDCMDEKCADLIRICQRNAACTCMSSCLGQRRVGGIQSCLTDNGLGDRPPGFAALEECVGVACPDSDECATPAGWRPPPDVSCPGSTASIAGGALADCGFDPALRFNPEGAVLQLQSADGTLCARVRRRNDGAGPLANTKWTLVDIRVGPVGQVGLASATTGCWYSSHHNFRDWIHAWTGTRRFDLAVKEYGHGGMRKYELYVYEQGPVDPAAACAAAPEGSTCIKGPILLLPVNP